MASKRKGALKGPAKGPASGAASNDADAAPFDARATREGLDAMLARLDVKPRRPLELRAATVGEAVAAARRSR